MNLKAPKRGFKKEKPSLPPMLFVHTTNPSLGRSCVKIGIDCCVTSTLPSMNNQPQRALFAHNV